MIHKQNVDESAPLDDLAREIEFIAAVRQGLEELDCGEGISLEDVERELSSLIIE